MKKYAIKAVLAAVVLIFAVPIAINLCYSVDTVIFPTQWGAADVLSYYGTILGAVVTVGALIVTILFTRKQIERDAYRKSQREKWDTVHQIVMDAIEKNNPMRLFSLTIWLGDGDITRCVHQIQEFTVESKISLDSIKCYISPIEYGEIETLTLKIVRFQEKLLEISSELSWKYQDLSRMSEPGYYDQVKKDQLLTKIESLRTQLTELWKDEFQHLLDTKRETFDLIYSDIENQSTAILRLWRKKTNADA